jgi:hypothetical protein
MKTTLDPIKALVARGEVKISNHGYDELAEDAISVREVVASLSQAEPLEDYPNFPKGPCVLVLQYDTEGKPIHVVWGLPRGTTSPAVLITAYRPSPEKWTNEYRSRKI